MGTRDPEVMARGTVKFSRCQWPGCGAITDVADVRVGHVTIVDEGSADPARGPARTGVAVVLPHGGNMFRQKVPAAFHVIDAFGKAVGGKSADLATGRLRADRSPVQINRI